MIETVKITLAIVLTLGVLFKYLQITFLNIVIILVCTLILSLTKYSVSRNPKYYQGYALISSIVVVFAYMNSRPDFSKVDVSFFTTNQFLVFIKLIILISFPVIYCLLFSLLFRNSNLEKSRKFDDSILYFERKKDLERLCKVFKEHNVIGVVGDWGSGKSFLTKCLEIKMNLENKDEWNFVRISLLSCKVDKVELIIINEIENILTQYKIASSHTRNLKNILGSSNVLNSIFMAIFPEELYGKSIENLKKQLISNNIKVVIVAEDIDRVDDSMIIDKLINITNALQVNSLNTVKILYEYNYSRLISVNSKLDRDFLDKYVTSEVYVTPIAFERLINSIIVNNRYQGFTVKDFLFLNSPTELRELNAQFSINLVCRLNFTEYPVRKVEHFLESINNYLEETRLDMLHLRDNYLRAIIIFFYIKYFDTVTYNRLENFNTVIDSFVFEERDSKNNTVNVTTLKNLLTEYYSYNDNKPGVEFINEKKAAIDRIANIIKDPINTKSYIYLSLLRYNIYSSNYQTEKFILGDKGLQKIYYNESIDALFRNMLWKGKDNKPDINLFIENLNKNVFSFGDESQWFYLFNTFVNNNSNKLYQDNNGFPITGVVKLSTAFRFMAMMIYEEQHWLNMIKLLFNYIDSFQNNTKDEETDWDMVNNCLAYVSFRDPQVLYFVLERYTLINFKYSFANNERYWVFLNNILQTLSLYGNQERIRADLATLSAYTNPINTVIDTERIINDVLLPLKESIESIIVEANTYEIPTYISNELSLYSNFITNNIDCLRYNVLYKKIVSPRIASAYRIDKRKSAINDILSRHISDKKELDDIIVKKLTDGSISVLDIDLIKKENESI